MIYVIEINDNERIHEIMEWKFRGIGIICYLYFEKFIIPYYIFYLSLFTSPLHFLCLFIIYYVLLYFYYVLYFHLFSDM
jgi:hypothetical protein